MSQEISFLALYDFPCTQFESRIGEILKFLISELLFNSQFVCNLFSWFGSLTKFQLYTWYQGMVSLTTSAILPKLRPPPCKVNESVCQEANSGQLAILYISLLLAAIGAGGVRPCVVSFGADQFDETDPAQKTKTWKFSNWHYLCMGEFLLAAVTVVFYIQG